MVDFPAPERPVIQITGAGNNRGCPKLPLFTDDVTPWLLQLTPVLYCDKYVDDAVNSRPPQYPELRRRLRLSDGTTLGSTGDRTP